MIDLHSLYVPGFLTMGRVDMKIIAFRLTHIHFSVLELEI